MIAIAIALVAAFAPQQDEMPGEIIKLAPPWDYVDLAGWTFQDEMFDGGGIMLTRPAAQPRHIWIRHEYSATNTDMRSSRVLLEVDCNQWRSRMIQLTVFSESNLNGNPTIITPGPQWTFAAPDTMAEGELEAACSR